MRERLSPLSSRIPTYGWTTGFIVASLVVGIIVKHEELRLTPELMGIFDPPSLASALSRLWMAVRFSWQELATATACLLAVVAWQRAVPEPRRGTRIFLIGLQLLLALGVVISLTGFKYYAVYHGHMTTADFENIGWAKQIAASAKNSAPVQMLAITAGLLCLALPWYWARRERVQAGTRSVGRGALVAIATVALAAFVAGRPSLMSARLEPSPLLWFVWGPYATYVDLPPIEALSIVGPSERVYEAAERPRNLILIVLESTPASGVAVHNPSATGGRRLVSMYGDEITAFDDVFAVAPNSISALVSVLTGRSPFPNNQEAILGTAGMPSLAQVLKSRGFDTFFICSGPSSDQMDALLARGFDRALTMDREWPRKHRYAQLSWGYDDRLLVDEAEAFLEARANDAPPFFLVLYMSNPHHPYDSGLLPGLGDDPDPRERHRRLVGSTMDRVTDLYEYLKKTGLAETTAVLAYGDHGQAFGEHAGNFIHSKELFRENTHVPMFLLHPRRLGLPARIAQLGTLDDVMPTVLDLFGIPAPAGTGMSLLFDAPERSFFTSTELGPGVIGLRDRRYFYAMSRTGRELLFDLLADPGEQHNLRDERPDLVATFRARLGQAAPH